MISIAKLAAGIEVQSRGRLTSRLLCGADEAEVIQFAPLDKATPSHMAFCAQSQYLPQAQASQAGVLILTEKDFATLYADKEPDRALVVTKDAYAWFAYALQILSARPRATGSIHPKACIDPTAQVDPTAVIGAGVVIESKAKIAARCVIDANTVIGENVTVGEDTHIYPNVTVYHDCVIGARVILHAGSVIGADGFGFAPFMGEWVKIPQIGAVVIGDDVEIGAGTTVDRGALDNTVIARGTKLDNQIQIGHNCRIGEDSLLCACTGIAGSTTVGSHCVIAGAANINGHITIPDMCQVGPATSIQRWEKGARVMVGYYPAQERRTADRTLVNVMRINQMREKVRDLDLRLEKLEKTAEE